MSITITDYNERFIFASITDRDAYIDYLFPQRHSLMTPGCFKVPGGSVTVFCELVAFYPKNVYYHKIVGASLTWYTAYARMDELMFGIDFPDILAEAIEFWLEDLKEEC